MNKLISGIVAIGIYFAFIFLILLYYNVHKQKAKNYVEENSNRVTVTLVNSDKTVFNKRSKINIPKKPVPKHQTENKAHHAITPIPVPIPKRDKIKSNAPSKKEILAKKRAKREKLRKAKREKLAKKRKEEAKKKREAQKLARLEKIKKEREEKKKKKKRKSAKSLFASIKTKERPKKEHKRLKKVHQSRVKHTSSITDKIRSTHQSGKVSNRNRDRGVKNAYIAKVKRQLSNWNAQSNYKGESAKIKITIMSNGHFKYTVRHSSNRALTRGLREFLEQLNRIGLGRHNKSTPYIISVTFKAR